MFKTNTTNPIITHTLITEYDMRHGNTSILRQHKIVQESLLDKWDELPGELRQRKVGLYAKKHPDKDIFAFLEKQFDAYMDLLIDKNGLTEDDVLAIKRDAIFVRAKELRYTHFGDYIVYRPKNHYVGFLLLDGKEFYQKEDGRFDIKGIGDDMVEKHRDGILDFINGFLNDFEYDMVGLHKYCKEFVIAYKRKELPWNYYRELNQNSQFLLRDGTNSFYMDFVDESLINELDISYNYIHIVLPLLQYLF